jgi:hypothetical protein
MDTSIQKTPSGRESRNAGSKDKNTWGVKRWFFQGLGGCRKTFTKHEMVLIRLRHCCNRDIEYVDGVDYVEYYTCY